MLKTSRYRQLLETAESRTRSFGFRSPELNLTSKRYLDSNSELRLDYATKSVLADFTTEVLYARCVGISQLLKPIVEEVFDSEVYLTIGHILLNGEALFRSSEDELYEIFKDGINEIDRNKVNTHAWLTLDSLEIIDFTFPTTYGVLCGHPKLMGGTIAKHPEDAPEGMVYEPMLVGDLNQSLA